MSDVRRQVQDAAAAPEGPYDAGDVRRRVARRRRRRVAAGVGALAMAVAVLVPVAAGLIDTQQRVRFDPADRPPEDADAGPAGDTWSPTREARMVMELAMVDAWLLAHTDYADDLRVEQLEGALPQPHAETDRHLRGIIASWRSGEYVAAYEMLDQVVDFPVYACDLDIITCDDRAQPTLPGQ